MLPQNYLSSLSVSFNWPQFGEIINRKKQTRIRKLESWTQTPGQRRKLNVHKMFRRRPGRLMYVQFTSSAKVEVTEVQAPPLNHRGNIQFFPQCYDVKVNELKAWIRWDVSQNLTSSEVWKTFAYTVNLQNPKTEDVQEIR